jgi:hypothetical protein
VEFSGWGNKANAVAKGAERLNNKETKEPRLMATDLPRRARARRVAQISQSRRILHPMMSGTIKIMN